MFGNRFSSSITCSRWRYEPKPGRLDQSLSCRSWEVATHPEVLVPDPVDLRREPRIPLGAPGPTCGIRLTPLVSKVGRGGDGQDRTHRLDPVQFPRRVDEGHHYLGRRSSSACAKNAEAFRRISFARLSSRFSRSSVFSRSRSSVVRPGRRPVCHARPGAPIGAASRPCTRSSRPPTESPPIATRAGARGRTPTEPPVPGPPVSTSSVFPWTPSSQTMEPLGNPGRFISCAARPLRV